MSWKNLLSTIKERFKGDELEKCIKKSKPFNTTGRLEITPTGVRIYMLIAPGLCGQFIVSNEEFLALADKVNGGDPL